MYVSRLFSGLEEGIERGEWSPEGVPTVYKLIEGILQSQHELFLTFTIKNIQKKWKGKRNLTIKIKDKKTSIIILPFVDRLPNLFLKYASYINELNHLRMIWKIYKKNKPDIVYFDRSNVYCAAFFAYFLSVKVVWRVMGVPNSMKKILTHNNFFSLITRLAYKAPFSMALCTEDGSGGYYWMHQALSSKTQKIMMMNGVDFDGYKSIDIKKSIPQNSIKILFVSRLVDDKGCLEFMSAFIKALDLSQKNLFAIIVGDGNLGKQMKKMALDFGIENKVLFVGSVSHKISKGFQHYCDIYASLNQMCNITNANIEAMSSGICMMVPNSRPKEGIDVYLDKLMPKDSIYRYGSTNNIENITNAIIYLSNHTAERKERSEKIQLIAKQNIPTWKKRISNEIKMLESLVEH